MRARAGYSDWKAMENLSDTQSGTISTGAGSTEHNALYVEESTKHPSNTECWMTQQNKKWQ